MVAGGYCLMFDVRTSLLMPPGSAPRPPPTGPPAAAPHYSGCPDVRHSNQHHSHEFVMGYGVWANRVNHRSPITPRRPSCVVWQVAVRGVYGEHSKLQVQLTQHHRQECRLPPLPPPPLPLQPLPLPLMEMEPAALVPAPALVLALVWFQLRCSCSCCCCCCRSFCYCCC